MMPNKYGYGVGDASYLAAGGIDGLVILVDAFYRYMDELPEAQALRAMHDSDLALSSKKLAYFLSGWLGGPRLYSEHFGQINIPSAHKHLKASNADRDVWMLCMQKAIDDQPYSVSFKEYLYQQLRVPAQRVVDVGQSVS